MGAAWGHEGEVAGLGFHIPGPDAALQDQALLAVAVFMLGERGSRRHPHQHGLFAQERTDLDAGRRSGFPCGVAGADERARSWLRIGRLAVDAETLHKALPEIGTRRHFGSGERKNSDRATELLDGRTAQRASCREAFLKAAGLM